MIILKNVHKHLGIYLINKQYVFGNIFIYCLIIGFTSFIDSKRMVLFTHNTKIGIICSKRHHRLLPWGVYSGNFQKVRSPRARQCARLAESVAKYFRRPVSQSMRTTATTFTTVQSAELPGMPSVDCIQVIESFPCLSATPSANGLVSRRMNRRECWRSEESLRKADEPVRSTA